MSGVEGVVVEEHTENEVKVGTVVREVPEEKAKDDPRRRGPEAGRGALGKPRNRQESGILRTLDAIRTVMPLVQSLLPLLDGNVPLAVANLLAPRGQAKRGELEALEGSVAKVRAELGQMHDGIATHESALKRIEEQVETMKDALERSVAEQKDVADGLRLVQRRVTTLTVFGLLLLVLSIAANVVFLLRVGQLGR